MPEQDLESRQGIIIRLVPIHHKGYTQPGRLLRSSLTILGSGDGADVILASSKVDAAHAAIVRLGLGAYVADLAAPGGTTVNGRRVRWARLANHDELAVGPFKFRLEAEESFAGDGAEEPSFNLRNESAIGIVSSIDPILLIGSDPGCDAVLRHSSVAPRHSIVVWTDEGPVVRDLHRQENTRLNGRRINFGRLVNGDSIGIGPFEFIFETHANGQASCGGEGFVRLPALTDRAAYVDVDSLLAGRLPGGGPKLPELWTAGAGVGTGESVDCLDADFEEVGEAAADETMERPETESYSQEQYDPERGKSEPRHPTEGRQESGEEADVGGNDMGDQVMSSTESAMPAVEEEQRGRSFDKRYAEVRVRVAAAQQALDLRAQRIREGLSSERDHLRVCRAELQQQAERLLQVAKDKQRVVQDTGLAGIAAADMPIEMSATDRSSAPSDAAEGGPDLNAERCTGRSGREWKGEASTGSLSQRISGGIDWSDVTWQARARELAEMVRTGREELDSTQRRLHDSRIEIRRLQNYLVRNARRHQKRDADLQARLDGLERAHVSLREEREKLLARIQRVETREQAIRSQLEEADGLRKELAREAEELSQAKRKLDQRQQALRSGIEEERQRLRMRQAELRRKTTELAQAARTRRFSVEEEMASQHADLEQREAELRARRAAVQENTCGELQKTTAELEELLGTGLSDLEADLETRQAELDVQAAALIEEGEFAFSAPQATPRPNDVGLTGRSEGPPLDSKSSIGPAVLFDNEPQAADDLSDALAAPVSAKDGGAGGGRLDLLVREIEALQGTLARIEGQPAEGSETAFFNNGVETEALSGLRESRRRATSMTQMREMSSTLRGAPGSTEQRGNADDEQTRHAVETAARKTGSVTLSDDAIPQI